MDPLKAAIGAQLLVLRHGPMILNWRGEGAARIRLDQHGAVVDDLSANGAAQPGRGYYAHLELAGIAVGAAVGGEKDVWELRGPDWEAHVTIHAPASGDRPTRVKCKIQRSSPAGLAFLIHQAG